MGRRAKLEKFAEVLSFANVYENYTPKDPKLVGKDGAITDLKGKWAKNHFGNNAPIVLELACGKGDYAIGMAKMYPGKNFIGVDIKGNRIWRGAKTALEQDLKNVAFLRTRIEQIEYFFDAHEVSEIWITFPDPFERKSKANRRLTSPNFLKKFKQILDPKGLVHLKTDADRTYKYRETGLYQHGVNISR